MENLLIFGYHVLKTDTFNFSMENEKKKNVRGQNKQGHIEMIKKNQKEI